MNVDPKRQDHLREQSLALEWVSRVLAVCVVMVLPGLGGGWLDRRLGTGYWAPCGFVFGFVSGTTALILLVQREGRRSGDD